MAPLNGNGNGNGFQPRLYPAPVHPNALPPQNLEAEMGVLGSVLLDNAVFAEVAAVLRPEDFYRNLHQVIYRIMLELADQGRPIDAITLLDLLPGRAREDQRDMDDYVSKLLDATPHAANALYYAQIVQQKATVRAVAEAGQEALADAYSNQFTAEQVWSRAAARLEAIEAVDGDEEEFDIPGWPEPPEPAAYHGLAGEIVGAIADHSEADPVALLVSFLVAFGSMVGRGPHWRIEASRHGLNLFACIVGNSSIARKGTSWDHVRHLLEGCDPGWPSRIKGGLTSGEGLAEQVKDPVFKDGIEVAQGASDKRLLVVESEFGDMLGKMARDGNSLSGELRKAWDGSPLGGLARNNPAVATHAHVSLIGHVTEEELKEKMSHNDAANGFANRLLWVCARRHGLKPHGGELHLLDFTGGRLRLAEAAAVAAEGDVFLERDGAANRRWEEVYADLTTVFPGLYGKIVSRAAPQVMRLACLYALLDQCRLVGRPHLEAALALWRYCERSARHIFGASLGDPEAEKVLAALRAAGERGLTQNQLSRLVYSGHRRSKDLARTLTTLVRNGLVRDRQEATTGRPRRVWTAS